MFLTIHTKTQLATILKLRQKLLEHNWTRLDTTLFPWLCSSADPFTCYWASVRTSKLGKSQPKPLTQNLNI